MSRLLALLILFNALMVSGTLNAHLLDVKAAEAAPAEYSDCVYEIYGVSAAMFEDVYGRKAECN